MRRTVRPALFAATLVTGVLVAGCSTTVTGTAAPAGAAGSAAPSAGRTAPAGGDGVTWINTVCGSVLGFAKSVTTPPALDSSSPAKTVKGLSTYLGGAVTALDNATSQIKAAGPSPIEGGDQAATAITGALATVRTSFQDAKTQIDAVDPNDTSAVAAVLPKALAPLQKLGDLPDASTLKSTPELDRAAEQAPNCQAVQGLGG